MSCDERSSTDSKIVTIVVIVLNANVVCRESFESGQIPVVGRPRIFDLPRTKNIKGRNIKTRGNVVVKHL